MYTLIKICSYLKKIILQLDISCKQNILFLDWADFKGFPTHFEIWHIFSRSAVFMEGQVIYIMHMLFLRQRIPLSVLLNHFF